MKKTVTILLLTVNIFQLTANGQNARDIIQKSTHYFAINNRDSLFGDGAVLLKRKISGAQFFLIGEQDDVQQIEYFTKAMIPILKSHGFNNYMTEIGPIAANELEQIGGQNLLLKTFNGKYAPYLNGGGAPFGFFGTNEEEVTLKQLNKFNINLLGIDFENYNSYLFLIDKIYKNADKEKVSEQLFKEVRDFIISEYKQGKNGFNPELAKNLLNSKKLNSLLQRAKSGATRRMIEEFSKSLYINNEQGKGNWCLRVENMKNNFVYLYKSLQKDQVEPLKIFFKLGAVHTARGTSFSGFQEVGNTIYELSKFNQTRSFSIITFPRYVYDAKSNSIEDMIEKDDSEILEFTAPKNWSLIDLKELVKLSIEHGIKLNKNVTSYTQKYDAILVPPATKYSEKNY